MEAVWRGEGRHEPCYLKNMAVCRRPREMVRKVAISVSGYNISVLGDDGRWEHRGRVLELSIWVVVNVVMKSSKCGELVDLPWLSE